MAIVEFLFLIFSLICGYIYCDFLVLGTFYNAVIVILSKNLFLFDNLLFYS